MARTKEIGQARTAGQPPRQSWIAMTMKANTRCFSPSSSFVWSNALLHLSRCRKSISETKDPERCLHAGRGMGSMLRELKNSCHSFPFKVDHFPLNERSELPDIDWTLVWMTSGKPDSWVPLIRPITGSKTAERSLSCPIRVQMQPWTARFAKQVVQEIQGCLGWFG